MKVAENFDIREFVGESTWRKWATNSTWFLNPKVPHLAQTYKIFFLAYYKKKYEGTGRKVVDVLIVVNNWHYQQSGAIYHERGYRLPNTKTGANESAHKRGDAFDCDIIIVFENGVRLEADYNEIHQVIKKNEQYFMDNGLAALEDVKIAATWLHSDCRWIPNQKEILIVKP